MNEKIYYEEKEKQILNGVYGKIVTSCDLCGNTMNNGGDEYKITVSGKDYFICPECASKYTLMELYERGFIPEIAHEYKEVDAEPLVYVESDAIDMEPVA